MIAYLVAMAVLAAIYVLLGLGLNLHWGHTGLVNFGHVGFFAVGAYASALLTLAGAPVPAGLAAAAMAAALAAWPLGVATLRLRGDYFALVTIGFSETVRLVLLNEEWLTRGPNGLSGIPRPFGGLGTGPGEALYLGVCAAVVAGAYALLGRLVASPYGRALRAVRDDEDAALALGKPVPRLKLASLILGAALAGLAGALFAHYVNFVVPEQFSPLVTFYVWIAVILGGPGSNAGTVLGTALVMLFLEGTRFLKDAGVPIGEVELSAIRFIVVGLALILLMRFRPQGLLGHR